MAVDRGLAAGPAGGDVIADWIPVRALSDQPGAWLDHRPLRDAPGMAQTAPPPSLAVHLHIVMLPHLGRHRHFTRKRRHARKTRPAIPPASTPTSPLPLDLILVSSRSSVKFCGKILTLYHAEITSCYIQFDSSHKNYLALYQNPSCFSYSSIWRGG